MISPLSSEARLIAGPVFVCFEYPGQPPHKARHRSRIVYPRGGRPFISSYPDPATKASEQAIGQLARIVMGRKAPTTRPVHVLIHALFKVPESWSARKREAALSGAIRPTSRPDWDNIGKMVDSLNKIVWMDDAQIVDGRVIKLYADCPSLRFEVREFF